MSTAAPAPDSPTAAPAQALPCPRCGKPLTDATGLGWCSACGYCRTLEENKVALPDKQASPQAKVSMGGLVELGVAVGGLPRWVWIMVLGVVVFSGFSFLPHMQLKKNSFDRALWTTCQIIVGLLVIFASQIVALVLVAPDDEKLSFKDVLMPTRLWGLTIKRLPRTYFPVWLGSWGLSLMLSALIIIGGLPYWMNYLPGRTRPVEKQAPRINVGY